MYVASRKANKSCTRPEPIVSISRYSPITAYPGAPDEPTCSKGYGLREAAPIARVKSKRIKLLFAGVRV